MNRRVTHMTPPHFSAAVYNFIVGAGAPGGVKAPCPKAVVSVVLNVANRTRVSRAQGLLCFI